MNQEDLIERGCEAVFNKFAAELGPRTWSEVIASNEPEDIEQVAVLRDIVRLAQSVMP